MLVVDSQIDNGIAVTGGIGSGKSRVCDWLAAHTGFHYISSDLIVRDLLSMGGSGWQQLREILGSNFFMQDQSLDKPKLRKAIFADLHVKHKVEGVLHPLVYDKIWQETFRRKKEADTWCLVEVPLLFECGWESRFAKVVVVTSPDLLCLDRVIARDKVTNNEAVAAFGSQMPLREKIERADFVIDNGGEWDGTVGQLQKYKKILCSLENA